MFARLSLISILIMGICLVNPGCGNKDSEEATMGKEDIQRSSTIEWLDGERVRGMYSGWNTPKEAFEKCAKSGFNIFMIKHWNYYKGGEGPQGKGKKLMQAQLKLCQELGLKYAPIFNFCGDMDIDVGHGDSPYRHTGGNGKVYRDGSPVDKSYWKRMLSQPLRDAAELSRDNPVDVPFILVDFEPYAPGAEGYSGYDYSDLAFNHFAKSAGINERAKDIPAKDRATWLERHNLTDKFHSWQDKEVEKIARGIAEEVRAIAPDAVLGFLPPIWASNWFEKSLIRGWGEKELPVLIFDEGSYSVGYTEGVHKLNEAITASGLPARYVPGFWADTMPPKAVAANMYFGATKAAGYWIYESAIALAGGVSDDPEEIWREFAGANTQIDKKLADPSHKTSYKSGAGNIFVPSKIKKRVLAEAAKMVPAYPTTEAPAEFSAFPPLRGNTPCGFFIIYLTEKQDIIFDVHNSQLGNYLHPSRYSLINEKGEAVISGAVDVHNSETITVELQQPGAYILQVANWNLSVVNIHNQYAGLMVWKAEPPWIGGWAISNQSILKYYFIVPEATEKFSITLCGEQHAMKVTSPAGAQVPSTISKSGSRNTHNFNSNGESGVYMLEFTLRSGSGNVDEIHFDFSSNIPPFVTNHPARLLNRRTDSPVNQQ